MLFITDYEFRAMHERIENLEMELAKAKTRATALETKGMTATKTSDPSPNVCNPEGVAGLGSDRVRDLVAANLKAGESDITMIENERGRFMKLTMGPILIPVSELPDKFSQELESLWATNGPSDPKASSTDQKGTK